MCTIGSYGPLRGGNGGVEGNGGAGRRRGGGCPIPSSVLF